MDITEIRTRHRMKAAEMARGLGISPGHMADLESGRRRLSIAVAAKLERLTGESGIVDAVVSERTSA